MNVPKRKIKDAIQVEAEIFKKAIARVQDKLKDFETKYGKLDRERYFTGR